jgi:hypothetical protein
MHKELMSFSPKSSRLIQQYVNDCVDSWDMQGLKEFAEDQLRKNVEEKMLNEPEAMMEDFKNFYHVDSLEEIKLTYKINMLKNIKPFYFSEEQIDSLLAICEFKIQYHQHFPDDNEEKIARDLYNHIHDIIVNGEN